MSTQSSNPKGKVTKDKRERGELSKQDQRRLEKVKGVIESALRKHGAAIFVVGRALNEAKNGLLHGTFLTWVDENLPFKRRTAQVYMRIVDVLSAHENDLGIFQLNTLKALVANSVSQDDRLDIISDIANATLTTDDAILERIAGLSPERSVHVAEGKAQRNAARDQLAKLTYDLAGDRLGQFIELLRTAGLTDLADRIEELATEPAESGAEDASPSPIMQDFGQSDGLSTSESEADPLPDFLPAHGG